MYKWNFSLAENPNFNFEPSVSCKEIEGSFGFEKIINYLQKNIDKKIIIDIPYYIAEHEIIDQITNKFKNTNLISIRSYLKQNDILLEFEKHVLECHKSYGVYTTLNYCDYYNEKIYELNNLDKGIIYGVGAGSLLGADIVISLYCTHRYAKKRFEELNVWWSSKPIKDHEKRHQYLETPIYDRHRIITVDKADLFVCFDEGIAILEGETYRRLIEEISKRPYQFTPYFVENCWGGGRWFKEVLGAKGIKAPGTSFLYTSVFEKHALKVLLKEKSINIPSKDLIYIGKTDMIGNKLYYKHGLRCPMSVLLVDTIDGGNTSLQVHPNAHYNNQYLNTPYIQNEGYYLLETTPESAVYMGIKEGVSKESLIKALKAYDYKDTFDIEKYITKYSVKPYDFIYLPGGCVHSFGKGSAMLEIDSTSSTTIRVYDWGRLDANGNPRPNDLDFGEKIIEEQYRGTWADQYLYKKEEDLIKEKSGSYRIGTMEYEPLEVYKHYFENTITLQLNEQLNIVVLTYGEKAIIESKTNVFEPFEIHYLEATNLPAQLNEVIIRNTSSKKTISLVQIFCEK